MRVPNGQSVSLMFNREHAIIMAADVLRRCDEKFEASVEKKEILHFEMTERDMRIIAALYREIPNPTERVRTFLNFVIWNQLKMPYQLGTMLADTKGLKFSCRAKRANPVLD